MTAAEYLYELRKRLKKLDPEEIDSAMSYYEEYFAEVGPAGEAALIERLGSPAQVASTIFSDYAFKDMSNQGQGQKMSRGIKTMWIVIIAVFASPVAIPLAFALVVVTISLLIALFSVFFALFAAAVAMVIAGLFVTVASFIALFTAPIEAIAAMGTALMCLALGLALGLGVIRLCQLTIRAITWIFAKILGRKGGQR